MHRGVHSDWNPVRLHLTFDFKNVKQGKKDGQINLNVHSLSCQLDGFLESQSSSGVYAAEENPRRRSGL